MAQSNKLARNIVANYLGQGWAGLMAVAFVPIYIDRLGIEAYGLIGFFSAMQALLAVFDLGVTPTLTREMAKYTTGVHTTQSIRNLLRSFEWVCYILSAVILIGVWMSAAYLAHEWVKADRLPEDVVVHSVAIMAAVFAARFLEGIYRGTLIGLERQVRYNVINSVSATARYAGAILVLQHPSATIETFFVWQAILSVLTVAALVVAVNRSLPRPEMPSHFSAEQVRSVWRFSAGMFAVSALSMVMISMDKLMLSALLPLDQFGIYVLASVAASVLYLLVVPITQAAYPGMVSSAAKADSVGLMKAYHRTSQSVAAIVGPAALCLGFFPLEIIYVWSGSAPLAQRSAHVLTLLAFAAFANCLGHLAYNLQLAYGKTKILIVANAGAVVLAIVLIPWAASRYGLIGAGWAWLAVSCAHTIAIVSLGHARLIPNAGWQWLLRDIVLPLAGAVAIVALAYGFRPAISVGRVEWGLYLLAVASLSVTAAALLAPYIRAALKSFAKI